jgi:hypothetical protein
MSAETILAELLECGITPSVTPDGNGIEVEAGLLNDAQRAAIRANKYELIACIQNAARITAELMAAAMRACDYWGDSPQAREQMRQDILNSRPEHRQELLKHFESEYPKTKQGRP